VASLFKAYINGSARRILKGLLVFLGVLVVSSSCTIKSPTVPAGFIPEYKEITSREEAFGLKVFKQVAKDYDIAIYHSGYETLRNILDDILLAAEADPRQWQLFLWDGDAVVDVRAVHGNYIFVWSGFLETAESDDEIAAILSCEVAHVLAGHTKPVEFTTISKIFFGAAEIATTAGLMILSQGAFTISGQGWMAPIYTDAADLDPLDREYSDMEERDAMAIAILLLERSKYPPQAMLTYWKRMENNINSNEREVLLDHGVPLRKRIALLEELMRYLHSEQQALEKRDREWVVDSTNQ
jgi:predicted Zn-dependent protease